MQKYRSLYTKFLLVMVPITFVSFVLFVSAFEWFNYKEAYSNLENKMTLMSASQSLILAEAVSNTNRSEVQLVIASTMADRFVNGVAVYGKSGLLFDKYGTGFSENSPLIRKTVINFADENSFEKVGTLVIVFTDQPIVDEIKKHFFMPVY